MVLDIKHFYAFEDETSESGPAFLPLTSLTPPERDEDLPIIIIGEDSGYTPKTSVFLNACEDFIETEDPYNKPRLFIRTRLLDGLW